MDKEEYLKLKYAVVEDKPITGKGSRRGPQQKIRHKHAWKICVLRMPSFGYFDKGTNWFFLASYCESCGKIGDVDRSDPFYRKMEKDSFVYFGRIPEKYVEEAVERFEVFDVDGLLDKYVSFGRSVE